MSAFSITLKSNVSDTVADNGDQTAELQMTGATNTEDRNFKCRVQSGSDEAAEIAASINVYGMLLQALNLST